MRGLRYAAWPVLTSREDSLAVLYYERCGLFSMLYKLIPFRGRAEKSASCHFGGCGGAMAEKMVDREFLRLAGKTPVRPSVSFLHPANRLTAQDEHRRCD